MQIFNMDMFKRAELPSFPSYTVTIGTLHRKKEDIGGLMLGNTGKK